MTRLKKELTVRGITFEPKDFPSSVYDESEAVLVGIDKDYLVTCYYSPVLPPILYIYDRQNLEHIATQEVYPDENSFGGYFNKWASDVV
jgi:hypothetical protein